MAPSGDGAALATVGTSRPLSIPWALLTGEYPPAAGGVSDYTQLVARGLAEAGDEVHVFAPACREPAPPPDPGLSVHRLPGHFGPLALHMLDVALDRLPRRLRILVQYVPHAFGYKGMNIPFCLWLLSRHREAVWTVFHEVAFPWGRPLKHDVLAAVHRLMALLVARASDRIFVTTPAWESLLRRLPIGARRIDWLPVPSNFPSGIDGAAASVRRKLVGAQPAFVLGHFGTFGPGIAPILAQALPAFLARDHRVALLIGRGGRELLTQLARAEPTLAGRMHATDWLPQAEIPAHLAACDLLIQPYPDGVSARRASLMVGLATGRPILTNEGALTEPIWRESGAVALAPDASAAALGAALDSLQADPARRTQLGERAADLYAKHFSLAHTIRALRHDP